MTTAIEGGWGYVVCFGVIITFISGIGHINSFGLIYNDFIIESKSTAKSLTTAHGVFSMMLAIGGIILNVLSKNISLRSRGSLGAILFCIGSFTTIFITNIDQLLLTFGLLQGIGFGMMVPVTYSTMNYYFLKKRTTVMSACKTIQGITLMWYPQLLKKMMENYGFRGTLLFLSAISLHSIPGMAVMKTEFNKARKTDSTNDTEIGKNNNAEEIFDLLSHNENTKDTAAANKKDNARFKLDDILCLNILKDRKYLNICLGQSFVNFSDVTFFVLQPMLLFQYGFDQSQVAICISIGAAADVTGRCLLTIISSITYINTKLLFYSAAFLTMLMRVVLLQLNEFVWISVATAALGVFRAWIHVASPLVISNHVAHEDFPGAYAIFMLVTGIVNLTLSPLIGLLKDLYQDYTPALYALSACCLPCVIIWPIEYAMSRKTIQN